MNSFHPIELKISGSIQFEENLVPTDFYQNRPKIGPIEYVNLFHLQMLIKCTGSHMQVTLFPVREYLIHKVCMLKKALCNYGVTGGGHFATPLLNPNGPEKETTSLRSVVKKKPQAAHIHLRWAKVCWKHIQAARKHLRWEKVCW